MRIAVLDDYQGVALTMADWSVLPPDATVTVFRDTLHSQEDLIRRLREFEIVCLMRERTPFPASVIEALPALRLIVTTGMRNASLDVAVARKRGVMVCGTEGSTASTAELTWGLLIALARRIPMEDRAIRAGRWQESIGQDLEGLTLGLVGLGRLGGRVAEYARAFRMRILAWSQNLTRETAERHGATLVSKEDLFAGSDFVSVHLVLSERTRGIVGAEDLGRMKPTACLINTSRAGLVDQAALLAALRERRIAGAGLDVYETEPLPRGNPFLALDNAILLPHLGYVTERTYRAFYAGIVEDVAAFMAGSPIRVLG
ncbi:MAG: D-2-hydroxyacid dehydrogenase family protein [Alphaproteobacteria bacterium]|nr:D-2-hydroxyacid dehydrogenase family protein [Alphaproteobacteria bacterium]